MAPTKSSKSSLPPLLVGLFGLLIPWGLLIHAVLTNSFHSTNLFMFSRHHIPTNGIAPFSAYQPTHNPPFFQSL